MTHLKIGVVGAGAMGSGIAETAASAGHEVWIYDLAVGALGKFETGLQKNLSRLVEKQKITEEQARAISSRIKFTNELDDFSQCSLIIEAVVEDLRVKQELFEAIERRVNDACILASNTSSLSIAAIGSSCQKPERVIGIHFFNPATLMPLVEIIPGIATDDAVVRNARALIDSWGKITVLAKDTPGFIVNRIARPFYGEAIRIFEEGLADMPTIDWAMKTYGGFRMGPFELMDFIGHDVNFAVTETVFREFWFDPRYKPSFTQKRLVEARRLGRKSGRGFYDYSEGAVMPSPVQDEALGQQICRRILAMLINEAADALYLRIASREDIDLAMTKGVNYPKGLLKWADELGVNVCLETLDQLYQEYHEDRYRASVLLRRMQRDGSRFYTDLA